jgi:hypothetical protein
MQETLDSIKSARATCRAPETFLNKDSESIRKYFGGHEVDYNDSVHAVVNLTDQGTGKQLQGRL